MILKPIFSIFSPSGKSACLTIFIFHRVSLGDDPLLLGEPDAATFCKRLQWITSWFSVLPLDVAISKLRSSSLPSRAAAITFDDGYADNFDVALPILKKFGIPATFFIATGFLDGGRMWNDNIIETVRRSSSRNLNLSELGLGEFSLSSMDERVLAINRLISKIKYLPMEDRLRITNEIADVSNVKLPNDLMMTSSQILGLRDAGMQIGAHTVNHPILANIGLENARKEISMSKAYLENLIGDRVSLFAYPNGKPSIDYEVEHSHIVRDLGFDAAFSTVRGVVNSKSDYFQLPRFTPWDRTKLRFGVRLINNLRRAN